MAWDSEPAMVSGLGQGGTYINPRPTVFDDSGTLKLILGESGGGFYGYYWNGSTWVLDSSIVTGLSSVPVSSSAPTVFNDSGTWKLISGSYGTDCYGYYWSGSAWVSDSSIVIGLPTSGYPLSTPHVFDDSGTFKLIMGCVHYKFAGYYWSGSTWVLDASIINGLDVQGSLAYLCVFNDAGTWKLIYGTGGGTMYGFYWTGTTWRANNAIQYGTTEPGWSSPTVFTLSSVFKMILGFSDMGNDGFLGYTVSAFDPTFTSNYDKGVVKSAYLLSKEKLQ